MKWLHPRFEIGLMRFRLNALDITSLHDLSALNDRGPVFDNTVLCLPSSSLDRLAHHARPSLPSSCAVQWVVGLLLLLLLLRAGEPQQSVGRRRVCGRSDAVASGFGVYAAPDGSRWLSSSS